MRGLPQARSGSKDWFEQTHPEVFETKRREEAKELQASKVAAALARASGAASSLPAPTPVAAAPLAPNELIPVASPVDSDAPARLPRGKLEAAKHECLQHADLTKRCLDVLGFSIMFLTPMPVNVRTDPTALHDFIPFRQTFSTTFTEMSLGNKAVRAYDANRSGVGFDCLAFPIPERVVRDAQKFGPDNPMVVYVGLVIAAPSGSRLLPLQGHGLRNVEITKPAWPAGYTVSLSYRQLTDQPLDQKETAIKKAFGKRAHRFFKDEPKVEACAQLVACVGLPNDKAATLYAGALRRGSVHRIARKP